MESIKTKRDKAQFFKDGTLKRAVVRSIEIIGEASKHIPEDLRDEYPSVPWRSVIGMRDRLIHGYFGIDYDIVWDVIDKHVPVLSETINEMLDRKDLT